MPATIAIVGCLDTKGDELRYVKAVLEAEGCSVWVIDTGVVGDPRFAPDTSRERVAQSGGSTLAALRQKQDRGHAVAVMAQGAAKVVRELHDAGKIDGVFAAGGSANTTIGATAMQALPVGVPKVLVSTLASGDVSAYVGTKDITLMYSVVDIAGINRISSRILSNAARAVAAMARIESPGGRPAAEKASFARPLIAATMFGVTTPCVNEARVILEAAGYEVLVFHATGTGGRAMEGLIEDGYFAGVLDITTTELADELVGGVLSAGPRRLTVAGEVGIPQVVSVGAIDMVNFGPIETVPAKFKDRLLYKHNPTVTLMRTTPEECAEIGRRIAIRLNAAKGPVKVFLPLRGVSMIAKDGGPFFAPGADDACFAAIRAHAAPNVEVIEIDTDVNDPEFARACANALLDLLESVKKPCA
jgi:uncharacterized protein (UPF0261 family)